jgi:hypothetical protein
MQNFVFPAQGRILFGQSRSRNGYRKKIGKKKIIKEVGKMKGRRTQVRNESVSEKKNESKEESRK